MIKVLRWTDTSIGENIVDIVLSIDEQTQKLYGQKVALASYSHVRSTLKDFHQIEKKLDEVDQVICNLQGHPGEYLRKMTNGFRYFVHSLQGEHIPYEKLIREIQELPIELIQEEKIRKLQEKIEAQLTKLGYSGGCQDKINKWLEDTLLPVDKVIEIAKHYVDLGKEATLKRIIDLPAEDGIDSINPINGVFWSGYSKYVGDYRGTLTFNIDKSWRKPIFAQVLAHEAYPGHQTFYCRWDFLYQQGKLPIEASYYLVNSPTNALFEGGPETALHFLGWDSENEEDEKISSQDKKQFALARDYLDMQRIAQTNACYLVNLEKMNKDQAVEYMIRVGLMNRLDAENSYRFFTDPIQRTYYPSYYYGRQMVWKAYDLVPKEKRQEYFKILYDTPHTTSTFIDAIRSLTMTAFDPFTD